MNIRMINEPLLQFGEGIHTCPRAGISKFMVYDSKFRTRRREILIGAVGTSSLLHRFKEWIEICSQKIDAKTKNKQPNLYTSFCGFNEKIGFKAKFIYEEEITKKILNRDIKRIIKIENWIKFVSEAVELYYENIRFLAQNRNVDVIVAVLPNHLYNKTCKIEPPLVDETVDGDTEPELEMNFRRALKAKTMHLGKPIQLVIEKTLKDTVTQQDIATKAWNFCTALYIRQVKLFPGN